MSEVKRSRKRITHRIAECHDCDWNLGDYRDKDMATKARRHAEKTGHTVVYETGTTQIFEKETP